MTDAEKKLKEKLLEQTLNALNTINFPRPQLKWEIEEAIKKVFDNSEVRDEKT